MRSRWTTVVAPVLALSLGACTDSTGPDREIVDSLVLDFCAGQAPIFFAYQNDGGDWTRVNPAVDNSFAFDVTERVAIAMTFNFGSDVLTDIYYATATDLAPLSDRACVETSGSKTVNGTVTDVFAGERAIVSMSSAEVTVTPPPSSFVLTQVADGPTDLVAHREVGLGLVPDRVIVRRALNPTNGATLPVLDFGTTTSDAVAENTATISGLVAGEDNLLDVFFQTALGTFHTLYLAPLFSTTTQTIYGVPATLTQSGDLHRIDLTADAPSEERYRTVRTWYRNPANQSLVLGAPLNVPSNPTFVSASPYLRMRIEVASQFDYGSFATAYFIQGSATTRSVFVTQTAGYVGNTPGTWVMEIPDVTDAGGYPPTAGLVSGQGTRWFVEAFGGSLSNFIGSTPTEGATVRWAGFTSSITLLRADGDSTPRTSRRPVIMNQRAFRR